MNDMLDIAKGLSECRAAIDKAADAVRENTLNRINQQGYTVLSCGRDVPGKVFAYAQDFAMDAKNKGRAFVVYPITQDNTCFYEVREDRRW